MSSTFMYPAAKFDIHLQVWLAVVSNMLKNKGNKDWKRVLSIDIQAIHKEVVIGELRESNQITRFFVYISGQFSSIGQSCPTLCITMNHSMPGLPVQLPEFTKTHVQNSCPLSQ